jgi:mannose-6-phosphate isomerase-like protein (cupin superfamily)
MDITWSGSFARTDQYRQLDGSTEKGNDMTFSNSTTQSLFQRRQVVLSAIAVAPILLAGTGFAVGSRLVGAQESATPAPGEGVTKEVLGTEISALAPDRVLLLQRRTFAPGSTSGDHPADGPVVLYVESGEVTFEVVDGAATATHAGANAETVTSGNEVKLATGDEISYDQGVVHSVYNEGSVPAVTLEARFNPNTSPATATPAP